MMELPAPGGSPPPVGRPGASPPVLSPPGGPSAATPQPQEGLKAQARIQMSNGAKQIISALAMLKEVGSEESRACLAALKALAPVLPDIGEGLSQSEAASQMAGAPAVKPAMGVSGTARPQPRIVGGQPGGLMGR